jgi:hypothetical protein
MALFMRATGKMIYLTDKEKKYGQIVLFLPGTMRTEKKKGRVDLSGRTKNQSSEMNHLKGILKMTYLTGSEYIFGRMVVNIQERGNLAKCREQEFLLGKVQMILLIFIQDNRKYEGEYENDLKHGKGTFTWPDGKSWSGQWIFGKMDGIGTLIKSGKQYIGEWKDGKRIRFFI